MKKKEIELYIHIPFCMRKCRYCDFLSSSCNEEGREEYVKALCQEIRETADWLKKKEYRQEVVTSIFFGGGTPSILTVEQIRGIVETIRNSFEILEHAEISIESNPGTLDREKLVEYKRLGINRLSIGLQSTENKLLNILGRIHTYEEFLENYQLARQIGFENINIDLMSALPGQSLKDYEVTLDKVLSLQPEHISAYSLIIEEGTPFYEDEKILECLPEEEIERDMYEMTEKKLAEHGYHRYEISNYAKVDQECRHNLGYWSDRHYLGFGLGASSYYHRLDGEKKIPVRFQNTSSMDLYIRKPFLLFEERDGYQELSVEEHMEEYMFLGLRKKEGISIEDFHKTFQQDLLTVYKEVVQKHVKQQLLYMEEGRLKLTAKGFDVSNLVMSDFLLSIEE